MTNMPKRTGNNNAMRTGKNNNTAPTTNTIPKYRGTLDIAESDPVGFLWSISSSISPHWNSSPQCGQSKSPDSPSSNSTSKLQCGHWMTTMMVQQRIFLIKLYPTIANHTATKELISIVILCPIGQVKRLKWISGLLMFTRGYAKHPCIHLFHSQGLSVVHIQRYP